MDITCHECSKKYTLEVRGHEVYRILNSELKKKNKIEELHHKKNEQIMEYADKKGYLVALKRQIEQLPSVSKIYKTLKPYLNLPGTEGTFRRHFSDPDKWISRNIFASNIKGVMEFLGAKDGALETMIEESEELWKLSRQDPPVVEPAICTVPREGKT
jgi:hypothetical protein